jgi:intracellular multiplication protein IcmD
LDSNFEEQQRCRMNIEEYTCVLVIVLVKISINWMGEMKMRFKNSIKQWLKTVFMAFTVLSVFFAGAAVADSSGSLDLGSVADNVTNTFGSMAKLITAASYIAGLGFAVGSILKFKAHKDNPQQITVGVPIALMFVAAALIFLPSMFEVAGNTLFGSSGGTSAGVSGITEFGSS